MRKTKMRSDYDGDGKIRVGDAPAIMRVAVGGDTPPLCPDGVSA